MGQTPNRAKCVTIRQEVSEISAIENMCSPKKWAKLHQFLGDATPQNP